MRRLAHIAVAAAARTAAFMFYTADDCRCHRSYYQNYQNNIESAHYLYYPHKHTYYMYEQGGKPCYGTLPYDHRERPFAAKLTLY